MKATIKIYQDKNDEYRVKVLANNNKNIANAGEGYKTHAGAENAVNRLKSYIPNSKVVDSTIKK